MSNNQYPSADEMKMYVERAHLERSRAFWLIIESIGTSMTTLRNRVVEKVSRSAGHMPLAAGGSA